MKYTFRKIILPVLVLAVTLSLSSCKKYLERSPLANITDEEPFKNFRNFQGFTEELYNCIPMLSGNEYHASFNLGEDELWEVGETRLIAYSIDQGDYWGWNSAYYNFFRTGGTASNNDRFQKGKLWGLSWSGIR